MMKLCTNYDPETLYQNCIECYVKHLNYNVPTLDDVQQLRYLPPGVLIDVYIRMSKSEYLSDMLYEQLSELEIFERLLKYEPARQRLFQCVAELVAHKKLVASKVQENYIQKYAVPPKNGATLYKPSKMVGSFENSANRKGASPEDKTGLASPTTTTKTSSGTIKARNFLNYKLSQLHHGEKNTTAAVAGTARTTLTKLASPAKIQKTTNNGEGYSDLVAEAAALIAASGLASDEENNMNVDHNQLEPMSLEDFSFGLRLGSFFHEAGWLKESIEVLSCVASHLRLYPINSDVQVLRIDCLQRLLNSQAGLCMFKSAELTVEEIMDLLRLESSGDCVPKALQAITYSQLSALYFARSEYCDSHRWSKVAMHHVDNNTPAKIAVDVLRQAAKACVVKRDYWRANVLISQAVRRAEHTFGADHQKFADTLLDYGFFLLNVDSVYDSVKNYLKALEIKRSIFGDRNFHVAVAHEDVSYACYVHEYSTGNFTRARQHVEKAVDIMQDLVPADHMMLASAKRVKALLLEEIALDKMADGIDEEDLLKQSEELHKFALKLSLDIFGEDNVQTAKHFGNLGRLYQTMNRFEEAELMHKKAIKIKTCILGPYDHEVGLSIGHLASLYNYHMKKYREAEELYFRSIEINLRLFGHSYSGLEYDYLGLCHVYEALSEFDNYIKYANILENWALLRGQNKSLNKSTYPQVEQDFSIEEIKEQFFSLLTNVSAAGN